MKFPPMFVHDYLLAGRDSRAPAFLLPGGAARTFGDVVDGIELAVASLERAAVRAGDRVIVKSDPTPQAIETFLACSRLGAVYVPVDPEMPAARFDRILEVTEPSAVVSEAGLETMRSAREIPSGRGRLLDTDLAYIIFTSGTTGVPKGISMSHHAVVSFWEGMVDSISVEPGSVIGSTAPLHFDLSILDLGLAWANGIPLVQLNRKSLLIPRKFVAELVKSGATHLSCVPSAWRLLLRHATESISDLTFLRGTFFGGEAFPVADVLKLRSHLPDLRMVNCFGHSESIGCSFLEVPEELDGVESLPIGPAYTGADIVLIDEQDRACQPGEIGEIYVRGRSLFSGYWRDPDATAQALVPLPRAQGDPQLVFRSGDLARQGDDGNYYYAGRRDHQVKVRGNRVELEEVERCLERHPSVVEAGVYREVVDGREGLVAVVVVSGTDAHSDPASDLRSYVGSQLPEYMVPRGIELVSGLPRNTAGKLDRRSLSAAHLS